MSSLIGENPILICLLLACLSGVFFYFWFTLGSRRWGIAAGVILLLIPGAVWLERAWLTEKEQLRAMIEEVAAAVESNQIERVEHFFHSETRKAWDQAKGELPRYQFTEARVTGYRLISVRDDLNPMEAYADFTVFLNVSIQGLSQAMRVPRRVRVAFRKDNDQWRVIGYEHLPPIGIQDPYQTGIQGEMPEWTPRSRK
jgi:hypothetical protein